MSWNNSSAFGSRAASSFSKFPLYPRLPPEQHERIDIAPHFLKIRYLAHAPVEVRRRRNRNIRADLGDFAPSPYSPPPAPLPEAAPAVVKICCAITTSRVAGRGAGGGEYGDGAKSQVRTDIPIPAAPYLDRRVREIPNLQEVWSYINPFMLFGRHLGYKGNFEKNWPARDPKALELFQDMEKVKEAAAKFMKIRAVWQFFEAERDGTPCTCFAPGASSPLHTFQVRAAAEIGRAVLERLCAGCGRIAARSYRDVRRDGGGVCAVAFGRSEAARRISDGACIAGSRDRNGGGMCGVAPSADS